MRVLDQRLSRCLRRFTSTEALRSRQSAAEQYTKAYRAARTSFAAALLMLIGALLTNVALAQAPASAGAQTPGAATAPLSPVSVQTPRTEAVPSATTGDAAVRAWRNFQYALGQPAAIDANADHPLANDLWRPIPAVELDELDDLDKQKFLLGFQLFHEGRLSSADSVACITCHAGPQGGVDGLRFSRG